MPLHSIIWSNGSVRVKLEKTNNVADRRGLLRSETTFVEKGGLAGVNGGLRVCILYIQ